MKKLETSADVKQLVLQFYAKVLADPLLSPLYEELIQEEEWNDHIIWLVNFWESYLFKHQLYVGYIERELLRIDERSDYELSLAHFSRWLKLWFVTVDELFEGETAKKAKCEARKMAMGLYVSVWNNRPNFE